MKSIHEVLRDSAGEPAGGSGMAAGPALNLTAALDRVGGDEELLRELAGLFIDDYPRQLQQIEEAIGKQDWKTAEREAHSLKGAVANFGASDASEAARAVEFAAREGRYSELSALLEGTRAEMVRVRAELDRLSPGGFTSP
ncbi:MAG TPA: Hpt domain-containing protein [Bryobacteraceae bacterium]|nr:Hpt domain-containing protein [Bryobacteraceae bacterium]